MLRSLMLILLVPFCFVAIRVGWPGAILVGAVTAAVYSFVFLRDKPGWGRVVVFISLFFLEALLIAWGLRWTLRWVELATAGNDQATPIFRAFAGTDILQNFWAIVGGFVLAAILFGLLFAAFAIAAALRQRTHKSQSRNDIYKRAMRHSLGMVPAKWEARDGKIVTVKAPKPPQQPMMGPGEIEVQRGHALILEKEGKITDVLPAGVHWVQDKERIAMLVPLYGRADKVTVRNAATRDGLQIEDFEVMIFHRVDTSGIPPDTDETTDDEDTTFAFDAEILRDRVWSASGNTWENGVKGVTEREARAVIADWTMEDLLLMGSEERVKFRSALQENINKITQGFMGVTVTVTGFGAINAPDLAGEKLMATWTAAKDRSLARDQATLQNDIMVDTAKARKEAFDILIGAMNDWLDRRPEVKDLMAMSFVERMERVETEGSASTAQDLEALSRLYIVEALKALTDRPESRS